MEVVVSYSYDSWGKVLECSGAAAEILGELNPFRYRGYVYDSETGFYYLNSRYYDPETGRFINADGSVSTGQGVLGYNLFAYCLNNPVNRFDDTGCMSRPKAQELTLNSTYDGVGIAVGVVFAIAFSQTISQMSEVDSDGQKISINNHTVYLLKDESGEVQYVGRTKNVEKRKVAHEANPERKGLDMEIVASNLTLAEARALEQSGMLYYHTINTANKMNNQINGVAEKFWDFYKLVAIGTLEYAENQLTNAILCWLGN